MGQSKKPDGPATVVYWLYKSFFLSHVAAVQGCFTLVTTVMEANLGIIAGISFGIAFFQVCRQQVTY